MGFLMYFINLLYITVLIFQQEFLDSEIICDERNWALSRVCPTTSSVFLLGRSTRIEKAKNAHSTG